MAPFIDLAWTLQSRDPYWVPPLRLSLEAALDRTKHPFHRHAEVAYFLAERGGAPVGRIAAIVSRAHNEFHAERIGFCGLFECEDDPSTAAALFDSAAAWLRERGMSAIRGPMNFSTNDEVSSPGVLIEGFDSSPSIMMSHNPPYYGALFEAAGFRKAKDLIAFSLERTNHVAKGAALVDRLLARANVTLRPLDMKQFRKEIDAIKQVYNAAWSRNWGFVPMSDAEFEYNAREFRPIVDPDLCFIAEADGVPVGFSLAMPNLNEALRHLPDGRLLPFGWAKLLWLRKRIRSIRIITLGLKPHLHRAGLGPAFYLHTALATEKKGIHTAEASWILEDNHEMVRALERMGAQPAKRYRIFERSL